MRCNWYHASPAVILSLADADLPLLRGCSPPLSASLPLGLCIPLPLRYVGHIQECEAAGGSCPGADYVEKLAAAKRGECIGCTYRQGRPIRYMKGVVGHLGDTEPIPADPDGSRGINRQSAQCARYCEQVSCMAWRWDLVGLTCEVAHDPVFCPTCGMLDGGRWACSSGARPTGTEQEQTGGYAPCTRFHGGVCTPGHDAPHPAPTAPTAPPAVPVSGAPPPTTVPPTTAPPIPDDVRTLAAAEVAPSGTYSAGEEFCPLLGVLLTMQDGGDARFNMSIGGDSLGTRYHGGTMNCFHFSPNNGEHCPWYTSDIPVNQNKRAVLWHYEGGTPSQRSWYLGLAPAGADLRNSASCAGSICLHDAIDDMVLARDGGSVLAAAASHSAAAIVPRDAQGNPLRAYANLESWGDAEVAEMGQAWAVFGSIVSIQITCGGVFAAQDIIAPPTAARAPPPTTAVPPSPPTRDPSRSPSWASWEQTKRPSASPTGCQGVWCTVLGRSSATCFDAGTESICSGTPRIQDCGGCDATAVPTGPAPTTASPTTPTPTDALPTYGTPTTRNPTDELTRPPTHAPTSRPATPSPMSDVHAATSSAPMQEPTTAAPTSGAPTAPAETRSPSTAPVSTRPTLVPTPLPTLFPTRPPSTDTPTPMPSGVCPPGSTDTQIDGGGDPECQCAAPAQCMGSPCSVFSHPFLGPMSYFPLSCTACRCEVPPTASPTTVAPTSDPTAVPTAVPSLVPTAVPSRAPFGTPSIAPSTAAPATAAPTRTPTTTTTITTITMTTASETSTTTTPVIIMASGSVARNTVMSPIVLILIIGFSLLLVVVLAMLWSRREKNIILEPGVSHRPATHHNGVYDNSAHRPDGGTMPAGYAKLRDGKAPDYDTVEAEANRNLVNEAYRVAPPKKIWKNNLMYASEVEGARLLQNGAYHPAPPTEQATDNYLQIGSSGAATGPSAYKIADADAKGAAVRPGAVANGAYVPATNVTYHVPLETLSHGPAIPNQQYNPLGTPGQDASARTWSVPVATEYGSLSTSGSRPSSVAYALLGVTTAQTGAPEYASPDSTRYGSLSTPGSRPSSAAYAVFGATTTQTGAPEYATPAVSTLDSYVPAAAGPSAAYAVVEDTTAQSTGAPAYASAAPEYASAAHPQRTRKDSFA